MSRARRYDWIVLLVSAIPAFVAGWLFAIMLGYDARPAAKVAFIVVPYALSILWRWPGESINALMTVLVGSPGDLHDGAERARLQEDGVLRFTVRRRHMYGVERVGLGIVPLLASAPFGMWGTWVLTFLAIAALPILLVLTILDLTGWSRLELRADTLTIGGETLPLSRISEVQVNGEELRVHLEREPKKAIPDVRRVWSRPGRWGREHVRFIRTSIEAARARSKEGGAHEQ